MALQHFSHEHRLVLSEVLGDTKNNNTAGEEILCYGCEKPIIPGSSAYSCCNSTDDGCHFFLHKTCGELPKEIEHPMHQKHTLTLSANLPESRLTYFCDVCQFESSGFVYNCHLCNFDVHINCALESSSLRHEGHEHELTLIQQLASFHCHVCSRKTEDFSYRCPTCPFWMHKSCASLPKTIYTGFHNHRLTLFYSIPEQHRDYTQLCFICRKRMKPYNWLYMCGQCSIFVHTKCTIERTISGPSGDDMILRYNRSENDERDLDLNLVNFPVPDESSLHLIMHQFLKGTRLVATRIDTIEAGDGITHWSHKEHPLILLDDHQLHQNKDYNEMKKNDKILICDGCVNHISAEDPYYACPECNFILHRICTELPSEIKHPFHPLHPVRLSNVTNNLVYNICNSCGVGSNGFFYACLFCNFWLDLGCAILPTTMKHDAHKHPLVLNKSFDINLNHCCRACSYWISNEEEYRCGFSCDFHVHRECATRWPGMIRHKWDDHPIQLVYGSTQNDGDVFYCEICEKDINPKFWFYTCHECDYSFHPRCLYPFDGYGNVKFGSKHKIDSHPHDLTFVRSTGDIERYPHSLRLIPKSSNSKSPPLCNSCGEAQIKEPVLECAPCKFLLCMGCVYKSTRLDCSSIGVVL